MSEVTEEHIGQIIEVNNWCGGWEPRKLFYIVRKPNKRISYIFSSEDDYDGWGFAYNDRVRLIKPKELKPVTEACLNKLCEFSDYEDFKISREAYLNGKKILYPHTDIWISNNFCLEFGYGYCDGSNSWKYCRRCPDIIYGDEEENKGC